MSRIVKHGYGLGDIIQLNDTDNPHVLMVLGKLPDTDRYVFLEMKTGKKTEGFITPKLWTKLA